MVEEKKVAETSGSGEGNQVGDTAADYLAAIKELKQNSVSRADYDKLKSENKQLLESVINGQSATVDVDTSNDSKETVKELRDDILKNGEGMTNLEYITKTLKLREELIKEGQPDPFEAGNEGAGSLNNYVDGAKVAAELQEMVDDSEGNPLRFNAEYKSKVSPIKGHYASKK